ncbi:MAG: TetR family transcriptional regulator C-terminal domain-containing protein [Devosia sp.]
MKGWDDALGHISPEREPIEAFEAYVAAKLDYTRRNAEESRLFANEVIRGAQFLGRQHTRHIHQVTDERVRVVEQWIAKGKMRPVDPRHLFIVLWSATQYYADFEPLACIALGTRKLTAADYAAATKTITQTVLAGLRPA